jgi:hypothetical protein
MVWTKFIAVCCGLSLVIFGAEKTKSPVIERADQAYKSAISKAQSEFDRAKGKATEARLKAYRDSLASATRAGDFDTATTLKGVISELEATDPASVKRAKFKDYVKFEDHEYVLIRDGAPWHVAKRICEEMGGHLATINSPREEEFLLKFCTTNNIPCWVGATDEVEEGKWIWVDGTIADSKKFSLDNYSNAEHSLFFSQDIRTFADLYCGTRLSYVCEWD